MDSQIKPENDKESQAGEITFKEKLSLITKHGFYLYLPPVQAVILYIICLISVPIAQKANSSQLDLWSFLMSVLILFSAVSPFTYLFAPKWWRNTLLYVASVIILNFLVCIVGQSGEEILQGPGVGEAGMGIMLAWVAPFAVVPFTGVIKLLINQIRKTRSEVSTVGKRIINKISISFGLIITVIVLPYTSLVRILLVAIVGHSIHFGTLNVIDSIVELAILAVALALSTTALIKARSIEKQKKTLVLAVISILIALYLVYTRVDSILLWTNLEGTGIFIIE